MTLPAWVRRPGVERIALVLACLSLATALWASDWLGGWDWQVYDALVRTRTKPPADEVVIVAVDERSLESLGRWPWTRRIHATLLEKLREEGARAVAFDLIFSEADTRDGSADAILAEAMRRHGSVVLPVYPRTSASEGIQPAAPLPALVEAAAALGHVDVDLDPDGVLRSAYLRAGPGVPRWPILPLALLRIAGKPGPVPLPGERWASSAADLDGAWIRDYRVLVPFAGSAPHFPRVSYADVLSGALPPGYLRDRLVLVGVTAAGLGPVFATPVSTTGSSMVGVEYHANVLDALLERRVYLPLPEATVLALTVALVLLPALLYPRAPPHWGAALGLALPAATLGLSAALLWQAQVWFPPAVAVTVLLLSYPLWAWRRLEAAARSLFEEQDRSQATLRAVGEAVITLDATGAVTYMNRGAESLTGHCLDTARGQRLDSLLGFLDETGRRMEVDPVARCLERGESVEPDRHRYLASRNGRRRAVRVSVQPINGPSGTLRGAVLAMDDVTQTLAMSRQMAYQATHDTLTRLPNRALLQDRLGQAMASAARSGARVAVLMANLDAFKRINESIGHRAGDVVLGEVAQRLQAAERLGDTVARWSGDQFVLVLNDLPHREVAGSVARRLLQMVDQPFRVGGRDVQLRCSVGIAVYPDDGADAEALVQRAEVASRRARQQGGDRFYFYAEEMNVWTAAHLALEGDLRQAIASVGLHLHFQPQLSLVEGRITGAEALIRWQHPTRGLLLPDSFLPVAEASGLMQSLGQWTLDRACAQIRIWQSTGLGPGRLSVNVSPSQFLKDDFGDDVLTRLRDHRIGGDRLVLEITENLFMWDIHRAGELLKQLKAAGVAISVDDFGTGYSSLSYLQRLPVDELKIDRQFVRNVTASREDRAITQAVIALAHSMDLTVVAEGVEAEAQLAFLRERRCDAIQGYYLARPLPEDELRRLLEARTGPQRAGSGSA